MTAEEKKPPLRCSFCNKSQKEVRKLIAGPTVYICDECVDICVDIITEDRKDYAPETTYATRCRACHQPADVTTSLLVLPGAILCERCLELIRPFFEATHRDRGYWRTRAESDVAAARALHGAAHYRNAALLCQRAAVNALRAVLELRGLAPRNSRSALELVDVLHERDLRLAARQLDAHAIGDRFPGGTSELPPAEFATEAESGQAIDLADQFLSFARSVIDG